MKNYGRMAGWAAAGIVSSGGSIANAATITARLDNVDPGRIIGVHYNGSSLGQAYAGVMNWTGNAANEGGLDGRFSSFCIDLTQDVLLGQTYSFATAGIQDAPNPLPPTAPIGATGMGATNAQFIEKLYALEYDNIGSDHDRGAAFQIAIWEILFDTSPSHDVTGGMFGVSGASASVVSLSNNFVAAALAPGAMTFHQQILALTSATAQDQLVLGGPSNTLVPPPPPGVPVPSPAAAFGALPLLGGLAVCRRIKGRNAL